MAKRFLFVTANENETTALLEDTTFFNYTPDKRSSNPDDDSFYNIGMFGKYEVVHFELQDQGSMLSGASLTSIYLAINYWKPDAVILVGISFGKDNQQMPEPRQHIGDVLISTTMQDYESGKVKDGKIQSDGPKPEAGKTLCSVFKHYAKSWKYLINGRQAKCKFGLLLSGDKVVDDVEFKRALFKAFPRAIGGEMEGRGAYSACRTKKLSEWIIVKAICDWGENKESPHKQENQLTAARSAVSLLKHVFSEESAFDKLPTKEDHFKDKNKNIRRPPLITPLGYFINIGTTSCRLFKIADKETIEELFVTSYDICDPKKEGYLEGIISHVKQNLLPKMQGNQTQLLQKVFVDYNFVEVFDQFEDPKIQKDFIRDFYKETNLYFNILSRTQTVQNLKRLFKSDLGNNTAIINIGSHSVDTIVFSEGEFKMYSLDITLADVRAFIENESISEIWNKYTIEKIKKYIRRKIGSVLDGVTVERAFILKDELRFMRETGYRLKMNEGHLSLTHRSYKAANREHLFSTNYRSKLASTSKGDESIINRLYGFKYGHIVIETILDLMRNKWVIPRDDLSIYGSINAYIFNVVISGSTHGDGRSYMIEAYNIMNNMGVAVLSPAVTPDGELAKDITPETEYDHLQAIDECDVLFVCNKSKNGYIGETTKCEIYYAYALRKTIAFWKKPPDDKRLSFIPIEHWGTIKSLVI